MTAAAELAAFGRRIAAQIGTPAPPGVDWLRYGHDAREAIGKGLPPPALDKYAPALTAEIIHMPAMAPAEARAIVREQRAVDFIAPKNCREVIRLRELGVISKSEARCYLGLRAHWWSR